MAIIQFVAFLLYRLRGIYYTICGYFTMQFVEKR